MKIEASPTSIKAEDDVAADDCVALISEMNKTNVSNDVRYIATTIGLIRVSN